MIRLLLTLFFLFSQTSWAFDISSEIQELDSKYRNYMQYPILIFNKEEITSKLSGDYEKDLDLVTKSVFEKFNLNITRVEADDILTYHTKLNGSATSLRFKDTGFCAVFPAQINGSRDEEVKRLLGISKQYNPYPKNIVKKAVSLVTLEELKLMSLYHELAHCLDSVFIPNHTFESSHSHHLVEGYAETLGLMMLQQKYQFNKLFLRRAALRSLYAKYFGKLLLTDPTIIVFEETEKEMGIVYDLSSMLLATQDINVRNQSLKQLEEEAKNIVEANSIPSRTISALRYYFQNDKTQALEMYKELAHNNPDLFFKTYINLTNKIEYYEHHLNLLLESL